MHITYFYFQGFAEPSPFLTLINVLAVILVIAHLSLGLVNAILSIINVKNYKIHKRKSAVAFGITALGVYILNVAFLLFLFFAMIFLLSKIKSYINFLSILFFILSGLEIFFIPFSLYGIVFNTKILRSYS